MRKGKSKRQIRKYSDAFLQNTRETVGKIRAFNLKHDDIDVRSTIEQICQDGSSLAVKLKNKPDLLFATAPSITKYVTAVLSISEKASTLSVEPERREKIKTTLQKISVALKALEDKINAENLLDLDIQLEVVESDLELDGFA